LTDFRWFLISLAASTLAAQVQGAAIAYQLYAITGDPLSLGLIGLAEAVPFIACALPAGHLADVRDRRRIGVGALGMMMLAAGGLWVVSQGAGHLGTTGVRFSAYGIIGLTGICRSFLQPARTALSADIVPRHLYPAAVRWRTGVWQVAAVAGPALGGAVYAAFGAEAVYGLSAALLATALLAWLRIAPLAPETNVLRARASLFSSLREGFAFLWQESLILPAIALDLFAVLFGGAVALMPIFAERILHVGPSGFGLLRAAPAVGALMTSLVLVMRPPFARAGRTLLVSVILFGGCMIGFGLSRSVALSLVLLTVGGAADMISVVIRGTLMQVRVPSHMLGRLSAINQIFIGSSNEIGAFESGLAARLMGTVPSVVAGGLATLVVAAVTAWRAPALRRLGPLR
jgi:MFS family permease